MLRRRLETRLHSAASEYPTVAVLDPVVRAKTTLVRAAFPERGYVSLQNADLQEFASRDPRHFSPSTLTVPSSRRTSVFPTSAAGWLYPRIYDKNLDPTDWLRNYTQTYVERDLGQTKGGETLTAAFFKNMRFWRKLPGSSREDRFLVYAGDAPQERADCTVLPWFDVLELPR